VLHLLFIYIFNSGASFLSNTAAGFPIYTATEGQNVSFEFPFTLVGGGRRFLCREECKNNNIIIETKSADAQNGSFNLRYRNGNLQVTIRELKMSDSGRYRCGVAGSSLSEVYEEIFEIRVTEELTSQNPVISSLQFQRVSSTALTDLHKTAGSPSTTAATSKQISLSALPLIVGGVATATGVSIAVFLILLYNWRTRANAELVKNRDSDTQIVQVTYENWAIGSRSEDSH
uniref:Immunoglobulin domain-containing protein n=1 Tax=Poecilia formosa TaxID=48698 RepID=A0A096MFY2_POEFO